MADHVGHTPRHHSTGHDDAVDDHEDQVGDSVLVDKHVVRTLVLDVEDRIPAADSPVPGTRVVVVHDHTVEVAVPMVVLGDSPAGAVEHLMVRSIKEPFL